MRGDRLHLTFTHRALTGKISVFWIAGARLQEVFAQSWRFNCIITGK